MNDGGHRTDDDALSALIDGALPEEEAAFLNRRIGAEPALARRLEELRRVDRIVHDAYARVAEEPIPQRIVDLVRGDAPVVPMRRRAEGGHRKFWVPVAAIAGLAAGFLVALLAMRPTEPSGPSGLLSNRGAVEDHSVLEEALDTAPSGETRDLGNAWSATPRLTFLSNDGRPCRRVDFTGANGSMDAVVCRRDGAWNAELIAYRESQKSASDGLYHPATEEAPSRLDGAIASMMQGEPLGREQERAWLAHRMPPPPK